MVDGILQILRDPEKIDTKWEFSPSFGIWKKRIRHDRNQKIISEKKVLYDHSTVDKEKDKWRQHLNGKNQR